MTCQVARPLSTRASLKMMIGNTYSSLHVRLSAMEAPHFRERLQPQAHVIGLAPFQQRNV